MRGILDGVSKSLDLVSEFICLCKILCLLGGSSLFHHLNYLFGNACVSVGFSLGLLSFELFSSLSEIQAQYVIEIFDEIELGAIVGISLEYIV